jgi:hypothetical protein
MTDTKSQSLLGLLGTIAGSLNSPLVEFPERVRSTGMEEVKIVYTKGRGKFSESGPPFYINLETDMYDFSGTWTSYQSGVNLSNEPPAASFQMPPPPPLPINAPPVNPFPAKSWTKGLFTFSDGAVLVQGPALTHLVALKSGDLLFSVTTSHMICGGTQLYEGARGVKLGTGTALVPRALLESGKFPSPGLEFPVTTIETFRIIRKQFLVAAASGGGEPPTPGEEDHRPVLKPGGPLVGGPKRGNEEKK